jgi:hypothetical protein
MTTLDQVVEIKYFVTEYRRGVTTTCLIEYAHADKKLMSGFARGAVLQELKSCHCAKLGSSHGQTQHRKTTRVRATVNFRPLTLKCNPKILTITVVLLKFCRYLTVQNDTRFMFLTAICLCCDQLCSNRLPLALNCLLVTSRVPVSNGTVLCVLALFGVSANDTLVCYSVTVLLTVTDFYWLLLTVTVRYCLLLTVTVRYCPLLYVTDFYWLLLSVTVYYWLLLTYCMLLCVTDCYWLLLSVTDCYWLTVCYCMLLTVTVRYCLLLTVTVCCWLLLSVTVCYWLLLTVTDCYCPLLSVTDCYCQLLSVTGFYWLLLSVTVCYWLLLSVIVRIIIVLVCCLTTKLHYLASSAKWLVGNKWQPCEWQ